MPLSNKLPAVKIDKSNGGLGNRTFARLAKRYNTPRAVQRFLRRFPYNHEKNGETARSALQALKVASAHCLEAAFISAAILEQHGYPPLIVSIDSKDGLGHIIHVFKQNGLWGSIARSRDDGLHGRAARFRSIRDLVWSYFDPYVDQTGRVTRFRLINLDRVGGNWRTAKRNLWQTEQFLIRMRHQTLNSSERRYQKLRAAYKKHGPMPKRSFWW